ncbi:Ubiquitin receptor RAD23b [Frankliniella fusca]|uniref:Ubiquitin receptor RAD23b n=1 Tax=Frankliniella fusca TaxID=407009 RepID=A0AAE1H2M7_9NEOP|nr:Ubiquitin receptor RAD23b [Frankliniella fusca]
MGLLELNHFTADVRRSDEAQHKKLAGAQYSSRWGGAGRAAKSKAAQRDMDAAEGLHIGRGLGRDTSVVFEKRTKEDRRLQSLVGGATCRPVSALSGSFPLLGCHCRHLPAPASPAPPHEPAGLGSGQARGAARSVAGGSARPRLGSARARLGLGSLCHRRSPQSDVSVLRSHTVEVLIVSLLAARTPHGPPHWTPR